MRIKHLVFGICIMLANGCTDLVEVPYSEATPEEFFVNDASVENIAVAAYAPLNAYIWNYWNISECTADEMQPRFHESYEFVRLNVHAFDPRSESITGLWNESFHAINYCNTALYQLRFASNSIKPKPKIVAEVRTLRAFYYYLLLDMFGNVPIIEKYTPNPLQASRKQVFEFCEKELREAIADLPLAAPTGRVTRGTAWAILNKLYLNAEVFTGSPRWQDCIASADAIIDSKVYSLEPNYYDNFKLNNENSREAIFTIQFSRDISLDFPNQNFYMRSLHYNQMPVSPWGLFCTVAEFYDTFDTTDVRSQALWIGPQFAPITWPKTATQGTPLKDRPGNPLIFTKQITSMSLPPESEGVRIVKYEPDLQAAGGMGENDYLIFRLSDILLSKAEALVRLGRKSEALPLFNQVRQRAYLSNYQPLNNITLADIYKERGNELYWEGFRRQDMIRFGTFWDAYTLKPDTKNIKNRTLLLPIPIEAMVNNPNLKQNPDY